MTKPNESKIIWCEPTNNRRQPYATMNTNGTLSFGLDMRDNLPRTIRIGFLPDECALCVEANAGKGFALALNGTVKVFEVASQLQRLGIELPAHFLFVEEKKDSLWKGYIVPPPRKPKAQAAKVKKALSLTECPHLLNAYKWLIDKAVYICAKTMPMDERRATAHAALWEAFHNYTPIHGPLKDYLFDEIRKQLIEKNKLYVRHSQYNTVSLDAPVKNGESDVTGYDLFYPRYINVMASVENKVDMEIFQNTCLDPHERKIFKMLLNGYTVDEIKHERNIAGQELGELCRSIGSRWEAFNQTDSAA